MLRFIDSLIFSGRSGGFLVAQRACRPLLALAVAAALGLVAASRMVQAAPINYGNFSGNTVDYLNVQEDSSSGDALPLFGPPSVSGNSLDFDPVGFNAHATGAGGFDTTNGNLEFEIMAHAGHAIQKLSLSEAGDTTLAGFGTNATTTIVTGTGVLNVTEVDGVGIAPIVVPISLVFSPFGGAYGLLSNGGGGPLYNAAWSGAWSADIEQVLNANNVSFILGATKVSIDLNNTLTALSEDGTFALIAKKDFGGLSVAVNNIPEPATWILMGFFGMAFGAVRRSR